VRKAFFSEEKKQKTFASLSRTDPAAYAKDAKVFWFFFSKKNCFSSLAFSVACIEAGTGHFDRPRRAGAKRGIALGGLVFRPCPCGGLAIGAFRALQSYAARYEPRQGSLLKRPAGERGKLTL
jgi:hypothetical protein